EAWSDHELERAPAASARRARARSRVRRRARLGRAAPREARSRAVPGRLRARGRAGGALPARRRSSRARCGRRAGGRPGRGVRRPRADPPGPGARALSGRHEPPRAPGTYPGAPDLTVMTKAPPTPTAELEARLASFQERAKALRAELERALIGQ